MGPREVAGAVPGSGTFLNQQASGSDGASPLTATHQRSKLSPGERQRQETNRNITAAGSFWSGSGLCVLCHTFDLRNPERS